MAGAFGHVSETYELLVGSFVLHHVARYSPLPYADPETTVAMEAVYIRAVQIKMAALG